MKSTQAELERFLTSAFSADELRRFLRYLPGGDQLSMSLPGPDSSLAMLVADAVVGLQKHGLLDAEFFERLAAERPRRRAEIMRIGEGQGPREDSQMHRSPGPTQPVVMERPSAILLHADDGLQAAELLYRELGKATGAYRAGGLGSVYGEPDGSIDILIVHAKEWIEQYAEPPSIACAVLFTPGLLELNLPLAAMLRQLRGVQRRGLHVFPVLVRATTWRTTSLGRLPPLPSNGVPIAEWRDPDAAWADVVRGITRVLSPRNKALPDRPALTEANVPETVRAVQGLNDSVANPAPAVLPIDQIFRTTGVPDVNFVAPAQLPELRLRMRFMGEGLIVEGPSGIGKTTATRHALVAELGADFETLTTSGRVQWIRAKSPEDVALLDRLLTAGAARLRGHLVIDDFHRLERPLQRRVADLIKLNADASTDHAKIVVIGINPVGSSLVQDFPDLAGRFVVVSMSKQPDAKLEELISRGEQAANIRFDKRLEFVRAARGSFFTAQMLCLEAAIRENIVETVPERRTVITGPDGVVLDRVQSRLKFKYHDALITFAAYDEHPPPRGATLILLWMLAQEPDSTVSLATARTRYPAVAPALEWLLRSNLGALFTREPRLAEIVFYNRDAAILSAEDPQLEFYLGNLSWPALARDSGHTDLDWDPQQGFLFTSQPSASAREPAAVKTFTFAPLPNSRVLHLSDLHFAGPEQAALWYDQLFADLRGDLGRETLDAVVVSGDISNRATAGEFDAAAQFLRDLQADFKLSPSQLVLVPGNHDLSWTQSEQSYAATRRDTYKGSLIPGEFIDGGKYVEIRDEAVYRTRFQAFADFYYTVRLEAYPLEYDLQATVHHFPGPRLLILGLNSAWSIDHSFRDRADIHGVALGRALRRIQQEPSYVDCLKLAVWHHPVHSPDPDRLRDTGFIERLAQAGFRLALHGHVHKPQQGLFRYDMTASGRRIDFLGAGTFGAPIREWQPGYPLQYQLLEFSGRKLTVHTRRREELDGAWKPDARWTQGPGQQPLAYYQIDL